MEDPRRIVWRMALWLRLILLGSGLACEGCGRPLLQGSGRDCVPPPRLEFLSPPPDSSAKVFETAERARSQFELMEMQ
jgi:hypothetical protein